MKKISSWYAFLRFEESRYRISGVQIWIFVKNPQYSNMNFCGFLFTRGGTHFQVPRYIIFREDEAFCVK